MKLTKKKKQQLVSRIVSKYYKKYGHDIWEKINLIERKIFYKKLFKMKEKRNNASAFSNAELQQILKQKF